MGPPLTEPSSLTFLYINPSVADTNLADMLKKAMKTIQNTAPGPPKVTAIATPAILPRPIVAERADVKA